MNKKLPTLEKAEGRPKVSMGAINSALTSTGCFTASQAEHFRCIIHLILRMRMCGY